MHDPSIISRIDDVNIKKLNAHHYRVWFGGRSSVSFDIILGKSWAIRVVLQRMCCTHNDSPIKS